MKKNVIIGFLVLLATFFMIYTSVKKSEYERQLKNAQTYTEEAMYEKEREERMVRAAAGRVMAERKAEGEKVAADEAYAEIENLKALLAQCNN